MDTIHNTPAYGRCNGPAVITAPRLRFGPVGPADMPLINRLLQASVSRTCDYTIGGIYMWIDWFAYEYCVCDDTLFIKGRTEDRPAETAFMLPVGALSPAAALDRVVEYCDACGLPPVFSAVPADRLPELIACAPTAVVEPLADWADYLYDVNALATFSGKHMMKKRNHFNRFVAENPHWSLEPLDYRNMREAMEFYDAVGEGEKTEAQAVELSLYERTQGRRVLDSLSSYPFEGVVLRGESGRIVAMAVGEVTGDTLYVHIEKMSHDVNGAGAAICKMYAARMLEQHPGLRYVNREEDCGDAGLREAKLSYHPAAILAKFNVRL